jgi:hypothetical protein
MARMENLKITQRLINRLWREALLAPAITGIFIQNLRHRHCRLCISINIYCQRHIHQLVLWLGLKPHDFQSFPQHLLA